ncbi:hypothetical protein BASA50_009082 [Batrachochytrium salamandrivorans]|uniref:Reverse transcriptase domain-containing protein n=1 Tax=Batrachochytrium salamandrivorans TaxID=1357716 RepID=A0ABQ8F2T8_9FUNG|nr:hypothetical protein BASA50_009082 [Batrachochytrium salamandrivorans]
MHDSSNYPHSPAPAPQMWNLEYVQVSGMPPMVLHTVLFSVVSMFIGAIVLFWACRRPSTVPPGPPGWPLFGNKWLIDRYKDDERFHELQTWLTTKYGRISMLYMYSSPIVFISDPHTATHILSNPKYAVAEESENLFEGLFCLPSPEEHKMHIELVKKLSKDLVRQRILDISMERTFRILMAWDEKICSGLSELVVDFEKVSRALLLDVCGLLLMCMDFDAVTGLRISQITLSEISFNKCLKILHARANLDTSSWSYNKVGITSPEVSGIKVHFKNVMAGLIRESRRTLGDGQSLKTGILGELLNNYGRDISKEAEEALGSEVFRMLLWCQMYLSSALSFVMFELLQNTDVLATARAEVDRVWIEAGGLIRLETLQKLSYIECVIKETLRLHPVHPYLTRKVAAPVQPMGFPLSPGTTVHISVVDLHRDPLIWETPMSFLPSRWQDGKPTPGSYYPFGDDPDHQIESIALVPLKAVIAAFLRHIEFQRVVPDPNISPARVVTNDIDVSGAICRLFSANPLYTSSSARARAGSLLSDPFPVQRGVRQRCPLSGLLFNLFINDILDGVAPITVPGLSRDTNPIRGLMYADDVVVFADSEQSLLAASTAVEQWANRLQVAYQAVSIHIVEVPPGIALWKLAKLTCSTYQPMPECGSFKNYYSTATTTTSGKTTTNGSDDYTPSVPYVIQS